MLEEPSSRRLYLIGFMGAGKTTVGKCLADRLGWRFLDLDLDIEGTVGAPVREIFARFGEPRFRQFETEALRRTLALDRVVVATGGGILTSEANPQLIRQGGVSIWLNPSLKTIFNRIRGPGEKERPLFQDEEQVSQLFYRRLPAYERSDLKVDVSPTEQPQEVASRIALLLGERNCVI